jgi:hypothetical protein
LFRGFPDCVGRVEKFEDGVQIPSLDDLPKENARMTADLLLGPNEDLATRLYVRSAFVKEVAQRGDPSIAIRTSR